MADIIRPKFEIGETVVLLRTAVSVICNALDSVIGPVYTLS